MLERQLEERIFSGVPQIGQAMRSSVIRHIAPEMLALLLIEAGLSFWLCWLLIAGATAGASLDHVAVQHGAVVALVAAFTSFLLGAYRPAAFARIRSLVPATALGGLLAFSIAWAMLWLLGLNLKMVVGRDPMWPTKIFLAWIGALLALRLVFQAAVRSRLFTRRVAVMGGFGAAAGTVAAIRTGHAGSFEVVPLGAEPWSAAVSLDLRASGVRTVVVPQSAVLPTTGWGNVELLDETGFWERHLRRVDVEHLVPAWFSALDIKARHQLWEPVYRTADVLTSAVLLLFTLPLMLLVAVLIRLDSPGPVLYRQERIGKHSAPFVLLKFRSMNCNAEARGPAWAQQHDPRVTRIGAFIRRTRIDELPQLINVLRGEMSVIGPRPERPHFVGQLAAVIPFYGERARVKPGLTGWAQVNFPYGASVADARAKLSYDLYYVKYHTPILDLMILFATVRVILFQEGSR